MTNDAFNLAFAGQIDTKQPFEIIKYLSKESDYLPWITAIAHLNHFTNLLESTPAFDYYEKFVLNLVTPLYNSLGWSHKRSDGYLEKY